MAALEGPHGSILQKQSMLISELKEMDILCSDSIFTVKHHTASLLQLEAFVQEMESLVAAVSEVKGTVRQLSLTMISFDDSIKNLSEALEIEVDEDLTDPLRADSLNEESLALRASRTVELGESSVPLDIALRLSASAEFTSEGMVEPLAQPELSLDLIDDEDALARAIREEEEKTAQLVSELVASSEDAPPFWKAVAEEEPSDEEEEEEEEEEQMHGSDPERKKLVVVEDDDEGKEAKEAEEAELSPTHSSARESPVDGENGPHSQPPALPQRGSSRQPEPPARHSSHQYEYELIADESSEEEEGEVKGEGEEKGEVKKDGVDVAQPLESSGFIADDSSEDEDVNDMAPPVAATPVSAEEEKNADVEEEQQQPEEEEKEKEVEAVMTEELSPAGVEIERERSTPSSDAESASDAAAEGEEEGEEEGIPTTTQDPSVAPSRKSKSAKRRANKKRR
jgi:hypothetical protein